MTRQRSICLTLLRSSPDRGTQSHRPFGLAILNYRVIETEISFTKTFRNAGKRRAECNIFNILYIYIDFNHAAQTLQCEGFIMHFIESPQRFHHQWS